MSTESTSRTPIIKLHDETIKNLYVKREDFIPYSFGGNKARKAYGFFKEIDSGDYDTVVTYGSSHSNHCRVVANMAAGRGMPCLIIGPEEVSDNTYNSKMMELFGAEIINVPVSKVHDTIEKTLSDLRNMGKKPYFIQGGGHGDIGTQAYVDCYEEIKAFEESDNKYFDYIFFASGTGTTQAGLVCGQILSGDDREIVGISIARKNPRGRDVVLESITDYLDHKGVTYNREDVEKRTIFLDDYTADGYGSGNKCIMDTISNQLVINGMPLDSTYTGKAFYGMKEYVKSHNLSDKTILFIHTGGTPLFFDDLENL
ncbi:MAG: pyridoxal-phosphate dependent enzyme [Butyrivibrio sp.]|nr:pyridoxal-phosphate dependent enzyme [Butyrivibrio sp.]